MGKHGKKCSQYSQQKLARAQHRNEFFRKLQLVCNAAGSPGTYHLIPAKELERIYLMRCQTVRVQAAPGQDVPAKMLNDSKKIVSAMLKQQFSPIIKGGPEISLNDLFSVGLSLLTYLARLKDNEYTVAAEIKKALSNFNENTIEYKSAWNFFCGTMNTIGLVNSDFDDLIYWCKLELMAEMHEMPCIGFCMNIYCVHPERIQAALDNSNRPAIRVGWGTNEPGPQVDWIGINASDLKLRNTEPEKQFAVYIQSHALMRLDERIDCIYAGMLNFHIYNSLKRPEIFIDCKGNYLFEYRLFDKKAGYLLGSMIEGNIIIRTFLFLTNCGTPEGNRLRKDTGLKMEDMKYLDIDKLSTFVHSDIRHNERVKEIFLNAGCGSLFEVDNQTMLDMNKTKSKSSAELIAMYLGLELDDTENENAGRV